MSRSVCLNLILMLVFVPTLGSAEEIYRTVDEAGRVIYSDKPVVNDARQIEVIELPPKPSSASVRAAESRNKAIREHLDEVQKERGKEFQQHNRRVKQAEKSLAEAEAHLAETKIVKDADRQSLAGGKRRIRPEYFERVKQAEAEVEAAKKQLQKVRSSR